MSKLMEPSDLGVLIVNHVNTITKSKNVEVAIHYDQMIICHDNTYLYHVAIPNTGVCLGLNVFGYEALVNGGERFPELLSDSFVYNKLVQLQANYDLIVNSKIPDAQIDDLRAHEDFVSKTTGLKSDDGARMIFIQGNEYTKRFIFPVYTGYPNLNKADKCGIWIYEIDPFHYIIKLEIYKQKLKKSIQCFSRHMNMDRPLIRF